MPSTPTTSQSEQSVSTRSGTASLAGTAPLTAVFLILSAIFLLCWKLFSRSPVDYVVLLVGNGLLFLIAMLSHRMSVSAMKAAKTQGFLRGVYSSFLLKFFVLAAAALIYIATFRTALNKPGFFGCFGLYLIYTFVETRGVMRANTRKNA